MKRIIPLLLMLLIAASCANQDYDMDKLDKEITLFQNEIAIPIGSAGPFNLELALQSGTIGSILGNLLKTDTDGYIIGEVSEQFYKISAYEIVAKTADLSQPFSYKLGDQILTPASIVSLLTGFGFSAIDQHISITINNPLRVPYTLDGTSFVSCASISQGKTSYEQSLPLNKVKVPNGYDNTTLLNLDIPDTVPDTPTGSGLKDLTLNLPADLMNQITSYGVSDFVLTCNYKGRVATGERLNMDLSAFGLGGVPFKINLPIGRFNFKDVTVSFELQNTLPMEVTLTNIKLLTGQEPAEDPNLEVLPGELVVKGGSPEKPGVTPVSLRIKAKAGAIPDISGLQVGLKITSAPGYADTRLGIKQGISVKSASATLRGGISFGGNE